MISPINTGTAVKVTIMKKRTLMRKSVLDNKIQTKNLAKISKRNHFGKILKVRGPQVT